MRAGRDLPDGLAAGDAHVAPDRGPVVAPVERHMTAASRLLPAFQEMGVRDWFTFFDLAKMLGFKQITISNGRDFAHQVIIE